MTECVVEQSITATINTELPDWYRTDTPHRKHPHNWDGQCLPDQTERFIGSRWVAEQ